MTKKKTVKTKEVFFKHVTHNGGDTYLPNIKYTLEKKLVEELKQYIFIK